MRRLALGAALLLGTASVVGACGRRGDAGTPAEWVARADAAFAAGDRRAAGEAPDAQTRAVEAWLEAARYYVRAFRLETPVDERRETRALLAFRAARAWSKAARAEETPEVATRVARNALFWFEQARRLAPALHQVHFERAALWDGDIADVTDKARALEAYRAYLEAAERTAPAAAEADRIAHARRRVEALAPDGG